MGKFCHHARGRWQWSQCDLPEIQFSPVWLRWSTTIKKLAAPAPKAAPQNKISRIITNMLSLMLF
jgi:hypothetical protein